MSLLHQITALMDREAPGQAVFSHAPSGMYLFRHAAPIGPQTLVYRPLFCLVLQGEKQVGTPGRMLRLAAGQSLVISHSLPVVSHIATASGQVPYVALVFPIDIDLLRGLAPDMPPLVDHGPRDPFSILRCEGDRAIEDALARHLQQCETPHTQRMLAPITTREIHARLLLGAHGAGLQDLLSRDSTASRIFDATRAIQSDLARALDIGELSRQAGMSRSAFFEHFRAVTGTSPLQYQKDLRLLHARSALQQSDAKIFQIALDVGYDNAAQFSREYARKFGLPPRQDRSLAPPP